MIDIIMISPPQIKVNRIGLWPEHAAGGGAFPWRDVTESGFSPRRRRPSRSDRTLVGSVRTADRTALKLVLPPAMARSIDAYMAGADACLIGRAYLYGLAAMGEAGVAKTLSVIREELRVSMSLTGVKEIRYYGVAEAQQRFNLRDLGSVINVVMQ